MGRSTPTTAFDGANLILGGYNVDTLNICMKEFVILFAQSLLKSFFQN